MKIFLVSEGKSEQLNENIEIESSLETIVRRTLNTDCTFIHEKISKIPKVHGKGGAFFKKAIRCVIEASKKDCDAAVVLIDSDEDKDRARQLTDAQDHAMSGKLKHAFGVAIETFDAWIVADETSWVKSVGVELPMQSKPEIMKKDVAKVICSDNLSEVEGGVSVAYARIAKELSIELLKERCPRGFGEFHDRLLTMKS